MDYFSIIFPCYDLNYAHVATFSPYCDITGIALVADRNFVSLDEFRVVEGEDQRLEINTPQAPIWSR